MSFSSFVVGVSLTIIAAQHSNRSNECICDLDVNRDASFGIDDYVLMEACIGEPPSGACATCDLDCDGLIGTRDLLRFYCQECLEPAECCAAGRNYDRQSMVCNSSAIIVDDHCYGGFNNGLNCALPGDCPSGACGLKNRYVSFRPHLSSGQALELAYRIKALSLDGFHSSDGQVRWLGPPLEQATDGSGQSIWTSALQCEPYFQDWSTLPLVHVYGQEIVPHSLFQIRAMTQSCVELAEERCSAYPILIGTGKWGDVIATFEGASQPNFTDIAALVDAFKNLPGAPPKTRAQLYGNSPNPANQVGFLDISAAVGGFQGKPFPFSGPGTCP